MKNLISLFFLLAFVLGYSQESTETANRFFYELSFKPKKDSTKRDNVLTILDITSKKSLYQDFTLAAQDSIIKSTIEEMERTKSFKDISKLIRMPKFTYKIYKTYPEMKQQYVDRISMNLFGYDDNVKLDWKILPDKEKVGEYNTQKATTDFAGRKWTAWFSTDIPFPDGPYKFYGLPGLIVKVEDADKDYSWKLTGNKKIENYEELSYSEKVNAKFGFSMTITPTSKEKFEKGYNNYKKDPMAEFRSKMTPEISNMKMPGSDQTIGEMMKKQEKVAKDFFESNDNPIERTSQLKVGKVEKVGKAQ